MPSEKEKNAATEAISISLDEPTLGWSQIAAAADAALSAAEKEREGEPGQMVTTAREVARWAYKQGVGEALAVDHLCDEVLSLRAREGDIIEKLREWATELRQFQFEVQLDGLLRKLNDLQEQSTPKGER